MKNPFLQNIRNNHKCWIKSGNLMFDLFNMHLLVIWVNLNIAMNAKELCLIHQYWSQSSENLQDATFCWIPGYVKTYLLFMLQCVYFAASKYMT